MFEKMKYTKAMRKKAEEDGRAIYPLLNTILHHYPIGLCQYERDAYLTLAVAYGNAVGVYKDDELPFIKDYFYFNSNFHNGSSIERGLFGMSYDKLIGEHIATLRADEKKDLIPIIKKILEETNRINPDEPKSTALEELQFIRKVFTDFYGTV